jgi:hypothetical protein
MGPPAGRCGAEPRWGGSGTKTPYGFFVFGVWVKGLLALDLRSFAKGKTAWISSHREKQGFLWSEGGSPPPQNGA